MQKVDSLCIVDDDPIYVFTTKRTLQVGQFCNSILVFNNGKEAYDNLSTMSLTGQNMPDMILLDLNMPIWDGWDFLNEFSKLTLPKKIIIYIVTSSKHPEDIHRAKKYNLVSNFIIKPITIENLKDELKNTP